jgi:hypothetical protein
MVVFCSVLLAGIHYANVFAGHYTANKFVGSRPGRKMAIGHLTVRANTEKHFNGKTLKT